MVAFPRIAPFQNLDRDATHTPIVHLCPRWTVDVDGISAGQGPSIVVDLVDLTGGQDQEFRAGRPSSPIGGRAADGPGSDEGRADGIGFTVAPMIALRIGVGSGSHF